jgi:hypothetical protein
LCNQWFESAEAVRLQGLPFLWLYSNYSRTSILLWTGHNKGHFTRIQYRGDPRLDMQSTVAYGLA